jgi:outer membrane lipopolysaccharide assembly protein LptE/RlpB
MDAIKYLKCVTTLVLVAVLTCSTAGCGYRFAGSAGNRIVSGQSLWVSFIRIEIDSPSAQTVLRRSILDECHAFRGLVPAGSEGTADLRIKGSLRSYTSSPMSYSALDQVREYRLTVAVDLELYRKGELVPFWKGTVQGYADYPVSTDLSLQRSAEEAALAAASRVAAQRFLTAVEQSY